MSDFVFTDTVRANAGVTTPVSTTTNVGGLTALSLSASQITFSTGEMITAPGYTGFRNRLINGGMLISQRGRVFTNTNGYTLDRWFVNRNGGGNGVTVSQTTTGPLSGNYCMKVQRIPGDSGVGHFDVRQVIETSNCTGLTGNNVTISAVIYRGNNFNVSQSVYLTILGSNQIDAAVNQNVWKAVSPNGVIIAPTTTPTLYTATVPVSSDIRTLMYRIHADQYTGTADADDSIYITNCQLELAPRATPFEYRPIGTELALCQRYYIKFKPGSNGRFGVGQCVGTTQALILTPFPVTMRAAPSALEQTGTATDYGLLNSVSGAVNGSSVPTLNSTSVDNALIIFNVASGITAGNATIGYANTSSSFLAFSSEL